MHPRAQLSSEQGNWISLAGNGAITQSGLVMNINQSTQRAVANLDSIDVVKGATVNLNSPNSSAYALNNATEGSASVNYGAVNTNGVTFGKELEVKAVNALAFTLTTSSQDFMDGKNTFASDGGSKMVNKSKITATGANSFIALITPEEQNLQQFPN